MCGIAGAFQYQDSKFKVSDSYLTDMANTMLHRGPDGGSTWVHRDSIVGFAHRRLSIIDLSTRATQPMSNEDGSVCITFNGEIYNHAAIRSELNTLKKINWKTDHSDTEVILRAYETWGINCLHRFRGMFAIGIWDQKQEALYLIRDRIGVKPLYYSIHHGRITFASEIKALLKDPEQKRQLNKDAVFDYLSFLTVPAPNTLFEGIKKLPGGHWLKIDRTGQTSFHRYWDVLDHTVDLKSATDDEIATRLLAELKQSVELRKVGDVPVGVFLSGGIDSSTNAALFSDGGKKEVNTFSVGYQGQNSSYENELHYAREVATLLNAKHSEVLLSEDDLLKFLPEMIHLQDEPIADPVCVPLYYVSKLARDNGVIVCQVGEGADELFWGYKSWKWKLRLQKMNHLPVPDALKRLGLLALSAAGKKSSEPYEWLRRGAESLPIFWGGAESFTEYEKHQLLKGTIAAPKLTQSSWQTLEPIHSQFLAKAKDKGDLNWMSYIDLNLRLPELLLMRVDKMSMGVSLEGRVPFLDHKFVEFSMSIPESVKTRDGISKAILKKAVRGTIPDRIIDRKKQGFGVPVYDWLQKKLGQKISNELEAFCKESGLLNWEAVQGYLHPQKGRPQQAWYLYNLALWWRHFIVEDGRLSNQEWLVPPTHYARKTPEAQA